MKFLTAIAITTALFMSAFSKPSQTSDPGFAFRNVDVFDGSRMIRGTTVVVRDGMIRGVGADVAIPPSAVIIDGKGKTLLPGLFDSHTHLGVANAEQFLSDALVFGVTTELEMFGSDASLAIRKKIAAGESLKGADLRTAGIGVTVPRGHPSQMGGPPIPTLGPNDDAQVFVDARIAEGADYVKVIYESAFPTLTKQQLADVIAAAHRRNKLAVTHSTLQRDAREAIAAGTDGLVHIFADSAPAADFADFAAQRHAFVIPTLSVIEVVTTSTATPWWQSTPNVEPYLTAAMRRSLEMRIPGGFGANMKLAYAQDAIRALHRAGVTILAGTDAPAPGLVHGLSLHRELELLVQSGFTPSEALASATSEPARVFGLVDRGRIAEGRRADLLLVNGDPTVDIKATRDIVDVWKAGLKVARPRAGS